MFRRMLTAMCLGGMICLAATAAWGGPIVASGGLFEVITSDPVPVGNPAEGPDLYGFKVTIVPKNAGDQVGIFDSNDPSIVGESGLSVAGMKMHQELFTNAGVTTPLMGPIAFGFPPADAYQHPIADPAAGIDSHFLFTAADILAEDVLIAPGGTPSEDYDGTFALSGEPPEFWTVPDAKDPGPYPIFGNKLEGTFGDSRLVAGESWDVAWIVAEFGSEFTFNALIANVRGEGEILRGTIPVVPEPSTVLLLLTGAVAALLCWRRRAGA